MYAAIRHSYRELPIRLNELAPMFRAERSSRNGFDLTDDAADGSRERVVMIHRGTVGSMERVVASLLERYQGRLPLWLAPVQVGVLPVAPAPWGTHPCQQAPRSVGFHHWRSVGRPNRSGR